MKTQIHNLDILKKALDDLKVKWRVESSKLQGFQGQNYFVDVVLEQQNGIDIGFAWNGQYELIADLQFWQQAWSLEAFLDRLNQRYAYQSILEETHKQNFEVCQEKNYLDGSVRLVVQRWTY
uniref:hypothetical protein n=1 Tax=Chroothece richteriana TaxID=101928 RepID=UPI001FCD5B54|nr:hypothetical protein MW631_pgp168 [Chroothece richteriana]UNJ14140.1 hypothetical protein [Chroothece richteriana]